MNKKKIISQLILLTKSNLIAAIEAAQNTYDIATHEENKAENKYDTRGLEASYLAGAQAERVTDIRATLASYESIEAKNVKSDTIIGISSLIEVCSADKYTFLLMMPKGGGQVLNYEDKQIQVITPESPIGKKLLGKKSGEIIEIMIGKTTKEYEIIRLF